MRQIFFAAALVLPFSVYAQVQLVTADEMRLSAAQAGGIVGGDDAPLIPRAAPAIDAPLIEILSPDIKGVVTSPAKVQLRFRPESPAVVRPESFKASYGAFRLDITSRLLQFAKPTPEGLIVEQANLPSGSHKILLEIQDSAGRTGTQLLSFTVQ
jgi:hypothetical protein